MTRERWEQVLFAHVPDEVVRDMLDAYVLELEAENAKLRELCWCLLEAERIGGTSRDLRELHDRARELGIEVGK